MEASQLVRETTAWEVSQSTALIIDKAQLESFAQITLCPEPVFNPPKWSDNPSHLSGVLNEEILCQYVLVLDALNFCFWPGGLQQQVV